MLYRIAASTARSIKLYSRYPREDEHLLPCGSSFVVQKLEANADDPSLLEVTLKQTGTTLLDTATQEKELALHRHRDLARLARSLAAAEASVDFVGRRFDFHQPVPPGLLALAISRCARQCSGARAVWQQDLVTLVRYDAATDAPHTTDAHTLPELRAQARALGVAEDSLEEALQRADSWAVTRQLVLGALEIELTLRQRGLSSLALHARCCAGAHHRLLRWKMRGFEEELLRVLQQEWPGCSATVSCLVPPTEGPIDATAQQFAAVDLSECLRAAARGDSHVAVGGGSVPLSRLGVGAREAIAEGVPPASLHAGGRASACADVPGPEPER